MASDRTPDEATPAGKSEVHADGVVIRSTGSWYDVMVGDKIIPSKVRGRFRLAEDDVTNPVSVGDRVSLRLSADDTGFITEIYERKNKLSRRAAGRRAGREHIIVTNIDRVWTIQSVRLPKPNTGFIDRVLVVAEAHGINAGLVINKMDLIRDREQVNEIFELYSGLGYPVLLTSVETGEGLSALRDVLVNQTNVLTGPSGVGKSSILNAIEPGLELKTSEVSEKTQKGRHTTTYVSLHPLSGGGFIVDTPGIREFGVLDIEPWELSHFFVEMKEHLEHCRFPTCTHDHEPGCAVKSAAESGEIAESRYRSYLNILDSINQGDKDVGR
jgi:ribosome biogenesis GTPase